MFHLTYLNWQLPYLYSISLTKCLLTAKYTARKKKISQVKTITDIIEFTYHISFGLYLIKWSKSAFFHLQPIADRVNL